MVSGLSVRRVADSLDVMLVCLVAVKSAQATL